MGLFSRKPKPEMTPMDRFCAAIDELNAAWAALPGHKIRPWIDWEKRKVMGAEYVPDDALNVFHESP